MSTLTRCRATYYEYTTTRALDVLDRHFEIDARLPAAGQLKIFAHYGWLDGPPSPLYVQRRMVQLARERYERALASAKRLHPGKTVTFPMTFAEFEKARSWEAGGGFYFIAPRSGGKGTAATGRFCARRGRGRD